MLLTRSCWRGLDRSWCEEEIEESEGMKTYVVVALHFKSWIWLRKREWERERDRVESRIVGKWDKEGERAHAMTSGNWNHYTSSSYSNHSWKLQLYIYILVFVCVSQVGFIYECYFQFSDYPRNFGS